MSFWKSRRPVTSPAHTALGKKSSKTWTFNYSEPLLTSVADSGSVRLAYTFSENPCFNQKLSERLNTLKLKIDAIQSCLQLTAPFSTVLPNNFTEKLIELFGLTEEITSTQKVLSFLGKSASSAFSSKKHPKKSLKSGRSSRG